MIFYVKNKIFFPFTKTVLHLIGKYGTGNREKGNRDNAPE